MLSISKVAYFGKGLHRSLRKLKSESGMMIIQQCFFFNPGGKDRAMIRLFNSCLLF